MKSFTQKIMDGLRALGDWITLPINAVWNLLMDFWDWFCVTANLVWIWILEIVQSICLAITGAWKWVFNETTNQITDNFLPMIQDLFNNLDLQWLTDLGRFTNEFFYIADYFVPLHEFFMGCTGLLTIWLSCFILKIILKLIPGTY